MSRSQFPRPWLYPNGTSKPAPVMKSSVAWYPAERSWPDAIGIDFGTSTLAVAYKVEGTVHPLNIQEECHDAYVPTVLLMTKNSGQLEIGHRALKNYCQCGIAEETDCIFFKQVKLQLHDDETVSIETQVEGSDGEHYYVVEVIALILREVRRKLADFFWRKGIPHYSPRYSLNDFHWVLTVPALWGEKARDMMREAAYMAGLCTVDNPKWKELLSSPLKPSRTHKIVSIKEFESNPERLSLVYEPDAAAAWCKQMSNTDVRTMNDDVITDVTTDNFFLTIDVGGGTIDITAHQVLDQGKMKRINIPRGEMFGGTVVNQAFQEFLEKEVVHDDGFTQYLSDPKNGAENKAELLGLVYIEFESIKKQFAENNACTSAAEEEWFPVQLPFSFAITYQTALRQFDDQDDVPTDPKYKKRTQRLLISTSKMSKFFDRSIAKLHKCISQAQDAIFAEHGDKFSIFYLVGGFGSCNLVSDQVRNAYSDGGKVKVLVPHQPELAVVKGACIYYDRQILLSSDATYGIAVALPYDQDNDIHVMGRTVTKNDEGLRLCNNLFSPIVYKGQELEDDVVYFLPPMTPANDSDRVCSIEVYRTEANADSVNYVVGEDREKLKQVAELKIPIPPEALELPREKRTMEALLDFTGIEIKMFARFKENGKRVNACIDFLSTLKKFDNI